MPPALIRTLRLGDVGLDVKAVRRACLSFNGEPASHLPSAGQMTFGVGMQQLVKRAQDQAGLPRTGVVGPKLMSALVDANAFDAYGKSLLVKYAAKRPTICSPIPAGAKVYVGGLHATAGLAGNWALDWICAPGTPILAVEEAVIRKQSGSSPDSDTWESNGVYGWSTHYETQHGYRYFATHLGRRAPLSVGSHVVAGQPIGWVGDQAFRPDHVHLGVTSPYGERDARKRICAVRDAQRVKL